MNSLTPVNPGKIQNAPKESEGEAYLKNVFDELGIKYEWQKPINGLRGDHKQYRIADFYLPKFNVYIEFLGLWNTPHCDEYKKKMAIYKRNEIPCVYIYPDNLGIIKYVLDKRIQIVLGNLKSKTYLKRYRFFKLKHSTDFQNRLTIAIGAAVILLVKGITIEHHSLGDQCVLTVIAIILVYQLSKLRRLYKQIFKENRYSLDNV
jgi:hypothetical protein